MLRIENLRVVYLHQDRRLVAARDVSFEIPNGATVGLVGESGSGKTTVALSVMRLIRPPIGEIELGSIWLDGVDLMKLSPKAMRATLHTSVGYIPQDPTAALDPLCRIGRHVDETLSSKKPKAERTRIITDLLESLGVRNASTRLSSYPHEFSGGMCQRVAIATALAREPKLVIADEPTTALDVTTQLSILRLLDNERRERDLSMLFVTHDLAVAQMLCQYIVVMYAGEVVENGPTDEVIAHPRHPYTRALIAAIPQPSDAPRARLRAIAGQPPAPAQRGVSCPFQPRCPLAIDRCAIMPELRRMGQVDVACWNAGSKEESRAVAEAR